MEHRQSITFRDDIEVRNKHGSTLPGRWKLLLAAFIIHFFGNGFMSSYGMYLVNFLENGTPAWLAFITQISYAITFTVTLTWCREITESWSGYFGYRSMASVGLLMMFSGIIVAVFVPSYLYPLNIGVFGGLGASILLTQVDSILSECFETHLAMVRVLCYVAQAVGQIVLPQLVLLMIQTYGGPMSMFLHSAVILQTLPAILYMKMDFIPVRPRSLSRYSDLSRINAYFNEHYNRNDLQLVELNTKSWQNPSDKNPQKIENGEQPENENDNLFESCTETPPPSPEDRRKNLFGVEILPEIPEESELSYSSDSDCDTKYTRGRFNHNIKRLSVMSDKLDELILRNDMCESCKMRHIENGKLKDVQKNSNDASLRNFEIICYHLSPSFDINREIASFQPQNKYRILSRLKQPLRLKRRITYCCYCINDTFLKPLGISLSFWRFYPALCLKICSIIVPIGITSLLPALAVFTVKVSIREASLLLTLFGSSWICMLTTSPWVTSMPKTYFKFVFVGGSFLSLAGLFILADTNSYPFVLISSVLLGLGHGAIILSSEDTLREWIGLRKWSKVRGTLEFLSSIGVVLVGASMAYGLTASRGVKYCFEILTLLQAVISFVWFLISISNIYFRKNNRSYEIGQLSL